MSEKWACFEKCDSARFARRKCAKMGARKDSGTSLVRTRTPSAFVRTWRAVSAHTKTKLVPLSAANCRPCRVSGSGRNFLLSPVGAAP
jgi:hypothetical protein